MSIFGENKTKRTIRVSSWVTFQTHQKIVIFQAWWTEGLVLIHSLSAWTWKFARLIFWHQSFIICFESKIASFLSFVKLSFEGTITQGEFEIRKKSIIESFYHMNFNWIMRFKSSMISISAGSLLYYFLSITLLEP